MRMVGVSFGLCFGLERLSLNREHCFRALTETRHFKNKRIACMSSYILRSVIASRGGLVLEIWYLFAVLVGEGHFIAIEVGGRGNEPIIVN